jgi:hypothetical protein
MPAINWGTLTLGATKTVTLYVRNQGTTPVTLSKTTTNLTPTTLTSYLTLNWNYVGQTVNPGAVQSVTVSLTVAANTPATSNFSLDMTITATG